MTPRDLDSPSFLGEFWLEPLEGAFGYSDQASVRAFGDAQRMLVSSFSRFCA